MVDPSRKIPLTKRELAEEKAIGRAAFQWPERDFARHPAESSSRPSGEKVQDQTGLAVGSRRGAFCSVSRS